jgi:S1-C subfamily serine protease
MESGGFMYGDNPDDTEGPGEEDALQKGWIAPDDRLWRHPSELSQHSRHASFGRSPSRDLWRERRGALAVGTFGAAAVVAAAVVLLALTNPQSSTTGGGTLTATEASLVTIPSVSPGIVSAVRTLRPSLVELTPAHDSRQEPVTGVVLPGGHQIVTSASSIGDRSHVRVLTSTGRRFSGSVIAVDHDSGVALVATHGSLDPATFADNPVYPGEPVVAACLEPGPAGSSAPTTAVSVGMVKNIGDAPGQPDGPLLMDAIKAEMPVRAEWGGVLLDGNGAVIGIPAKRAVGSGATAGFFVPAELALGVANELSAIHRVQPGWIGVKATDAPGYAGAAITTVLSGSPAAAAGLRPGDVVTEVDGQQVMSLPDLQARLYTMEPGRHVDVIVERSGSVLNVSLTVAAPSDG